MEISLFLKNQKKREKLDIRKKSTIFKISSPNFLCKLSTPKTPSTPILEPKFGHILNKLSLLVTYLSPFANFADQSLCERAFGNNRTTVHLSDI